MKLKSLICLIKFVGGVEGCELSSNVRLDVGLVVDMKNQTCLGANKLFVSTKVWQRSRETL